MTVIEWTSDTIIMIKAISLVSVIMWILYLCKGDNTNE
jgi:hypothetical protein